MEFSYLIILSPEREKKDRFRLLGCVGWIKLVPGLGLKGFLIEKAYYNLSVGISRVAHSFIVFYYYSICYEFIIIKIISGTTYELYELYFYFVFLLSAMPILLYCNLLENKMK
jgi:hypothetical protein